MNKKLLFLIAGIGVMYVLIVFIVFLANSRKPASIAAPLPAPAQVQKSVEKQPPAEQQDKPVEPEIEYEPKAEQGPLLM